MNIILENGIGGGEATSCSGIIRGVRCGDGDGDEKMDAMSSMVISRRISRSCYCDCVVVGIICSGY